MGTVTVLTCDDCGKPTSKFTNGRCRQCYQRHWQKTSQAGQACAASKAASRRSPATTGRKRGATHPSEDGSSAAWYSAYNWVPAATQELILRAYLEGHEPAEIATAVEVETNLVKAIIDRGAISPRRVEPYRCKQCRHKVITDPCFICWTKRRVSPGRRCGQEDA